MEIPRSWGQMNDPHDARSVGARASKWTSKGLNMGILKSAYSNSNAVSWRKPKGAFHIENDLEMNTS